MRKLRDFMNDPDTWRWTLNDSPIFACGCLLVDFAFWGLLAWLFFTYVLEVG